MVDILFGPTIAAIVGRNWSAVYTEARRVGFTLHSNVIGHEPNHARFSLILKVINGLKELKGKYIIG